MKQSAGLHVWCLGLLVLAVLFSGLTLVHSAHQSRILTSDLKTLQRARDELQVEWLQLQLEQSAVTAKLVVDRIAREHLQMTTPEPAETIYLRP